MVDIEGENIVRITTAELFEYAVFPAFGKVRLGIHILGKEPVFVGDAKEVKHSRDHIQVRDQDGLSEVLAEVLVAFGDPGPKPGNGFAQDFGVHLMKVGPDLESLVDLI